MFISRAILILVSSLDLIFVVAACTAGKGIVKVASLYSTTTFYDSNSISHSHA